ncbi:MAG: VWA domain-containing protein [Candidatus Pristimantibacillus lignocellulolyticus]|uniref:VWA domain-containing protein n=1 Tax=Candidatus Pristimantibacillus lignocellulolyticus TaxID=2994561 RepID=A0A9J6ZK32_9BACL|nr:MAG: VWA domain-containing protein [Candidatus Pristimantibacillus lignocellulolyticus]
MRVPHNKWRLGFLGKTVILAIIFSLVLSHQMIFAVGNSNQKIDVMLVIDSSTSMNNSDKNKVANEAMKLFVDMSSIQGDRIGVISYTDQIEREKALLQIDTVEDKQDLKDFIDDINRGPYTDLAIGVAEAVKVLEKSNSNSHFPMIVLLADGNNSLPEGRKQADSDKELQAAVQKATDNNIPIYTIGLNADGKLNKKVLEDLSAKTKGKSFVTSSAEDLPRILSEIFADHMKLKVIPLNTVVGNGQFQEINIEIPNSNVIEANISMMSAQKIEVKLIDPSGAEIALPSDDVVYSTSNAYTLLKLINPQQGDWKLQVKGVNEDKIDINLIFNYDLQVDVSIAPEQATYAVGDIVDIKATMSANGGQITDTEQYKDLKATLVITDMDTQQVQETELTNAATSFTGQFKIPDAHDYELMIKIEDANFYRESELLTISGKGAAQQATATPAPTTTPKGSTTPNEEEKEFPWLLLIIGVAALIIIIIAAILIAKWIKEKNRGFYGQLVIEVYDLDTNERTSPQYKKLNSFKGSFKLHHVLQLAPEFIETEKIMFKQGNDLIYVYNASDCSIEKSGRAFDATKGKELRKNERIMITLQQVNKSISLEYIV